MSTWRPDHTSHGRGKRPSEGDVVAYARAAWQVIHVDPCDLKDGEEETLRHLVQPHRDQAMPYRVALRRLHGPKNERENSARDIALRVRANAYNPLPVYADGRVPLCSCCSHPWPCRVADELAEARRGSERMEREMARLPGCCPACQEPITNRQHAIGFPGPYLRNPLSEPGPRFHLRLKCFGEAARYENDWVAADRARPRSLLTLQCAGSLIVHGDGSAECFGADGSDCPTVYARHRAMSACYFQSHGCGRGCSRARASRHAGGWTTI